MQNVRTQHTYTEEGRTKSASCIYTQTCVSVDIQIHCHTIAQNEPIASFLIDIPGAGGRKDGEALSVMTESLFPTPHTGFSGTPRQRPVSSFVLREGTLWPVSESPS